MSGGEQVHGDEDAYARAAWGRRPRNTRDLSIRRAFTLSDGWTEQGCLKARGETEAVILAGVLKDHIQATIEQAGVEGGVSTSGFVGCR